MLTEETLPTYIKEEEKHWLRRAVSLLHQKATEQKVLVGIGRVTGSTRIQSLAVRSITAFNSMPSGNKLVSMRNRMGMKSVSEFSSLVVKSQSSKLVNGMLSIAGPAKTQKNGT
eukprot:1148670-Pelagomonas_calceolata.AAC.1